MRRSRQAVANVRGADCLIAEDLARTDFIRFCTELETQVLLAIKYIEVNKLQPKGGQRRTSASSLPALQ